MRPREGNSFRFTCFHDCSSYPVDSSDRCHIMQWNFPSFSTHSWVYFRMYSSYAFEFIVDWGALYSPLSCAIYAHEQTKYTRVRLCMMQEGEPFVSHPCTSTHMTIYSELFRVRRITSTGWYRDGVSKRVEWTSLYKNICDMMEKKLNHMRHKANWPGLVLTISPWHSNMS